MHRLVIARNNSKAKRLEMVTFKLVEEPKKLIPILEERHPHSCFIYNQAVSHERFKDDVKFYILSEEINSNTWIFTDYIREDDGHNYSISAPKPITSSSCPIPPEIKESLISTPLINWDEHFLFVALEKPVSAMILDLCVNIKGNVSEVHPCILYYMDKQDALNLSISIPPETEVRRLDPVKGSEFIVSTWKYSQKGSDIVCSKSITANASAGVFLNRECASGCIIFGDGIIHCLYTKKEFRNRGLGKVTMHFAFKEFAKDGCIPCSTVEVRNERSIAFHKSLGVKSSSIVDYIDVKKLDID